MKTLLLITSLFFVGPLPIHAASPYFKVNVSGTVQTRISLGPLETRIYTAPLNNKRIFQEFQVSPDDYVLVVSATNLGEVNLVPKNSGGLPSILVFTIGGNSEGINDTKSHVFRLIGEVAPIAHTNLFQGLFGSISYTSHFKSTGTTKINMSVTAGGTAEGGGAALLKFKVVSSSPFTPPP